MTADEPKRLREEFPDLDLGLDATSLDPPPGAEDEVWARLESALGGGGEPGSGSDAPVSPKRSAAKVGVVAGAAGLAVALIAAVATWPRDAPQSAPRPIARPSTETAVAAAPPSPESSSLPVAAVPSPAMAASSGPRVVLRPPPPRSSVSGVTPRESAAPDTLSLEVRLVLEARAQVNAGDGPSALAKLGEIDARVPHGAMTEERESLRIQALVLAGRGADAKVAARTFDERYPNSPHRARVHAAISRIE